MTVIATVLPKDEHGPRVMVVMPDGKVKFALNPLQLWSLTTEAGASPYTFPNIHTAAKASDWIAQRAEALQMAREDEGTDRKRAIEAYIASHGVTVFASKKVLSYGLSKEPVKPAAKPKAPKLSLSPELLDMVKDISF